MIPFSTDAPLYHLPIGTAVLIVANVVCYNLHGAIVPTDITHPWLLAFGDGLHPLQWLSSMFAHMGIVHLAGNMYFLMVFGVIVEGKLGWRRFVPLYLTMGIISAAISQLMMLAADRSGAAGASDVVMALMAICLIWAPRNELTVYLHVAFRGFIFDISLQAYAFIYLCWEVLHLAILQFAMSTPALHLIGAAVGLATGTVYVKKKWVDCENWDLFAVLAGTHGRYGKEDTTVGSYADPKLLFGRDVDVEVHGGPPRSKPADESADLSGVEKLIDAGQFLRASDALFQLRLTSNRVRLKEKHLRRLASGLLDVDAIEEAELYLEEYEDSYPDECDWCRVRLAEIELQHNGRPQAALQKLKQVRLSRLSERQRKRARRVAASARRPGENQ